MATERDEGLETQIGEWRTYVQRRRELTAADTDELEDHLRDRVEDLRTTGLSADEAFLVAVKRIGSLDVVTREFAQEHSDRLWKQLVLTGTDEHVDRGAARSDLGSAVFYAVVAALALKVPPLFGLTMADDVEFYARNVGLFALVPLGAYLAWRRGIRGSALVALAAPFVVAAVVLNAFPFDDEDSMTLALAAIHAPIALWLAIGFAYAAGDWRSSLRRMDFIRFTCEWIVYFALIALGGGVLTGLTACTIAALGHDPSVFVGEWLVPCGAVGAVVIAAWLVEEKASVVENMAPVLAAVFTPLFTLALVVLVGGMLLTGGIDVDRDALILFDLLLVVVLGLLVYGISARDPLAPVGLLDRMHLVLVAATLVVDVVVLVALASRIGEFGFSANKTAALGENLVLLGNLAWSARLLVDLVRGRRNADPLQRWQTDYLFVYAAWAWVVIVLFPPVFGFA